jgi:SNF2 family DNA or RNA helicase
MNLLMNQRKVCQHPYLFGEPRDSKGEYVGVSSPETLVQVSGKLALLDRLLKRLKTEGHKVSSSTFDKLSHITSRITVIVTAFVWCIVEKLNSACYHCYCYCYDYQYD